MLSLSTPRVQGQRSNSTFCSPRPSLHLLKKGSQAYSSFSGTPSIIRQAGPRVRTILETRRYPIFHIFTPRKQFVADCPVCDTPQLGLKRQLSIRKNLRHPVGLVSRTHIHPGSNQVRLSWAVPEIHQDPAIRLVDQQPRLYFPLHHLHRVDDHLHCNIISATGRLSGPDSTACCACVYHVTNGYTCNLGNH